MLSINKNSLQSYRKSQIRNKKRLLKVCGYLYIHRPFINYYYIIFFCKNKMRRFVL